MVITLLTKAKLLALIYTVKEIIAFKKLIADITYKLSLI